MPKYIDLFAGCGGLSLGLEKAGLELELAVEKSNMAAETFYHNFIERIHDQSKWEKFSAEETPVLEQANKKLVVKELRKVLDSEELIRHLKAKDVDLIAGGPPCQGFSMAGRRNPNDVRNQLPWQFLELVEKLEPKTVVIENVAGMRQNFVKHSKEAPFYQLRKALQTTGPGYAVQPVLLNAMHFGVPQHRPRVMLIAVRKDIAKALNVYTTEETWRSDYDRNANLLFPVRPDLAPYATFFGKDIRTVEDAAWDIGDDGYKHLPSSTKYNSSKAAFSKQMREDTSWMPGHLRKTQGPIKELPNHVKRRHAELVEQRFRLYQYLRDNGISSKILNIPAKSDLPRPNQSILIQDMLLNARFPAVSPDGKVIARNLEELSSLIINLNTKKHSQRPLSWNSPSPTVVSLPDDFVHPSSPRTLTVRELARFQSFPDSFEFRAKETTGGKLRRVEVPQYTQVGNAVPPLMAEAVGKTIHSILKKYQELVSSAPLGEQGVEESNVLRGNKPQGISSKVHRGRAA